MLLLFYVRNQISAFHKSGIDMCSCHEKTLCALQNGSDKYFSKLLLGQTKDPKFRVFEEEGKGGTTFM